MNSDSLDTDAFAQWVSETIGVPVELLSGHKPPSTKEVAKKSLAMVRQTARVCAVYFLYNQGTLLYIGRSKNVYPRISQHMKTAPFDFDEFALELCDPIDICALEMRRIREFSPRWNRMGLPKWG